MYVANLASPLNRVEKVVGPVRVQVRASPELVEYGPLAAFSAGPTELKSVQEVNDTATNLYIDEAVPQNVVLAHEPHGWFMGFLSICMYGRAELTDLPYINAVARDQCYEGAHLSDDTARPGDALTCRGLEAIQRLAGTKEVPEVVALVRPENKPSLDMFINRYGFRVEDTWCGQQVLARRAGPAPKSLSPTVCDPLPARIGVAYTPQNRRPPRRRKR